MIDTAAIQSVSAQPHNPIVGLVAAIASPRSESLNLHPQAVVSTQSTDEDVDRREKSNPSANGLGVEVDLLG